MWCETAWDECITSTPGCACRRIRFDNGRVKAGASVVPNECQGLTFNLTDCTLKSGNRAVEWEDLVDQMNVSVTDHLAEYVRARVKSGRYNNASEVVREALRRMEEADQRALRLGNPTVEDVLTDLEAIQIEGIRKRVLEGIAEIERGEYTEYEGRAGLNALAADVVARGRERLKLSQE
jgi:antitoxin ParD1/3/4